MDTVETIIIERINNQHRNQLEDTVVKELPLTIVFNNQELVTLLCSPDDIKYLAVGFLSSEGLLTSKDEIKKILVDEKKGIVHIDTVEDKTGDNELIFKRMITSGCGKGASFYSYADAQSDIKVESRFSVSSDAIIALVKEFQHHSQLYKETHGVHSAALCDKNSIVLSQDDIGRHNAIDKIFGKCLLEGIAIDERMVITSGRISSEILIKVAKRNIPILASPSGPTNLGAKLATDLGITLVGFVRGHRMNLYSHGWRVLDNPEQQSNQNSHPQEAAIITTN
jgi:FdhD protein